MRYYWKYALLVLVCLAVATAKTRGAEPWYIDDDKLATDFSVKLIDLAKQGKCLKAEDLQKQLGRHKCKVAFQKPDTRTLTPEEVYQRALASVFVLGSVEQMSEHPEQWQDGRLATAWAVTEDGVLVTNWHVFDKLGKECYGVVNAQGEIFPLVEVLACDQAADIAVIRVAGKHFKPLPLAMDEKVGAWIGVLGHPGNQFFTFTQGNVSRYAKNIADGKGTHWMAITADFAYGSSGAPVLNRFGAVVGMATVTTNIDYPVEPPAAEKPAGEKEKPVGEKEKPAGEKELGPAKKAAEKAAEKTPEKSAEQPPQKGAEPPAEKAPEAEGSLVQMIVKLAVPSRTIREICEAEAVSPAPSKKK